MTQVISGKRIWTGCLLLLMGLFYLLYNFNALPFAVPPFVFSWKMAVILTGVYLLYHSWLKGLIIMGVGVYFVLPELGYTELDWQKMWPLALIFLGLLILSGSGFKKKHKNKTKHNDMKVTNDNYFDATAILGGTNRQIHSYDFKGGKITAVMGGLELDLTNCYLSKEGCVLDFSLVMGGVSLKVSREWNIKSEIIPVMSGIEDEDTYKGDVRIDPSAEVILRGSVVMSGIEIKRV